MLSTLLAFTLASYSNDSYASYMSCERWLQRSYEIRLNSNLDLREKINLINYLKSKVDGDCSEALVWRTQVGRGTERSSP